MESIAVIQPNMGVLPQNRLQLTPFGALAQTFAEEILARAQREEGRWSFVPLDLLEEGEEPPQPAPAPVIQVDLKLVLEALRREKGESEQRRAAERIVERVLQLREVRQQQTREKTQIIRREERPRTEPGAPRQQNFYSLTQENRFGPVFLAVERGTEGKGGSLTARSAPGSLGRRSETFAQRLRQLREQGEAAAVSLPREGAGEPVRLERGQIRPLGPAEAGPGGGKFLSGPELRREGRMLPEELTHLEEAGEQLRQAVQGTPAVQRALEELTRQGLEQLHRELTGGERKQTAAKDRHASDQDGGSGERTGGRQDSGKTDAAPAASGQEARESVSGGEQRAGAQGGDRQPQDRLGTVPPLETSARDPRVGRAEAEKPAPARRTEGAEPGRPEGVPGWTSGPELAHRIEDGTEDGTPAAGKDGAAARSRRGEPPERKPEGRNQPLSGLEPGQKNRDAGGPAAQTQTARRLPGGAGGQDTASTVEHTRLGAAQDIRILSVPDGTGERAGGTRSAAEGVGGLQTAPARSELRPPSGGAGLAPGPEGFAQGLVPGVELAHRTQEESRPGALPAPEGRQAPGTGGNRTGAERKTAASGGAQAPQSAREGSASPHTAPAAQAGFASGGKEGGQGRSSVRPLPLTARELPTVSGGLHTVQPLTLVREDQERDAPQTARRLGRSAPGEALAYVPQPGAGAENAYAARGGREQAAGMPPLPAGPELTYGPAAGQAEPEQGRSAAPVPQAVPQTGEGGRLEARAGASGRTAAPRPAGAAQAESLRGQAREGADRRSGSADSGAGAPLGPRAIQLIHPLGGAPAAPVRRDIRTAQPMTPGAMRSPAEPAGETALSGQLPPLELASRPVQGGDAQTDAAVRPSADGGARGRKAAGPVPRGRTARGPEPVELTYSPANPASEAAGQPEGAPAESEYVRKLPDWARRFLRSGAGEGQTMGSARNIASLSPPAEEKAVQWQAPNYRPPAAPITYREKRREEPERADAPKISEAELQRTADRVYRMIEDRIRRERRRLGL